MLKPKKGIVIRKNGKVFKDRVCPECGKTHFHGDNMCVKCRNAKYKKAGKYAYVKRTETSYKTDRQKRLARHTERIRREMKAIKKAGLSPENDSVQMILNTGVALNETINYSAFRNMAI